MENCLQFNMFRDDDGKRGPTNNGTAGIGVVYLGLDTVVFHFDFFYFYFSWFFFVPFTQNQQRQSSPITYQKKERFFFHNENADIQIKGKIHLEHLNWIDFDLFVLMIRMSKNIFCFCFHSPLFFENSFIRAF